MSLPIFGEIIMKKTIVDLVATQPCVFEGAFLRLSLRLHPRKPWSSKQWAGRSISTGYFHFGKAVPRQVESQYVAWLSLDTWYQKVIHCYFVENIFTTCNAQFFSKLQPSVI